LVKFIIKLFGIMLPEIW